MNISLQIHHHIILFQKMYVNKRIKFHGKDSKFDVCLFLKF